MLLKRTCSTILPFCFSYCDQQFSKGAVDLNWSKEIVIRELLGTQPGTVLKIFLFSKGGRSWADERVGKKKLVGAKSPSDHSAFTSDYQEDLD